MAPALDQGHVRATSLGDRPLAEHIATATRAVHAKLNKLIIARLPLALSPRASDSSAYISGLLHITPVYIAFESLWIAILNSPPRRDHCDGSDFSASDDCDPDTPMLDWASEPPRTHKPLVCQRLREMLEHLRLPGLVRSDRLRADLRSMTGWSDDVLRDQLDTVGQTGHLADFLEHIREVVQHKPHVLLAYSYILYMALFAGGRFIRASLEAVGDSFWDQMPSPVKPTRQPCTRMDGYDRQAASQMSEDAIASSSASSHAAHDMPLRFFHFPTPMDGEDLKLEFKRRLNDSQTILTTREKHDIIQEAVCIFDHMLLLVDQLDDVCSDDDESRRPSLSAISKTLVNPLGGRYRDSVFVAKQRSAKGSSRKSSEDSVCSVVKSYETASVVTEDKPPCPGLSAKAMRFDAALSKPDRQHAPHVTGSLQQVAKRIREVNVTNWVVLAALGLVVAGAYWRERTAH